MHAIANAVVPGDRLPTEVLRHASNLARHVLNYPSGSVSGTCPAPADVTSEAAMSLPSGDPGHGAPPAHHDHKGYRMLKSSLTALARQQLELAGTASSGRSASTVYGGHEHLLRQTVIALTDGQSLNEHENPGEATVHVLHGRVRLAAGDTCWDGSPGDLLIVPDAPHTLKALQDAAVLLTVVKHP